jgi:transcriptional regulator with XRE-family HTH domain
VRVRSMESRLREERRQRDWSLTKLSALTGIAATDISAIERGIKYAFPGWRRRLAAAFKVSERELFPDEGRSA